MSRLGLSLLGPFEAMLDGRLVVGFRSDKARALLVFLAVEAGRPHAREALAGLLWPDCPNATALTYLRHALANLRHLLENPAADSAIASPPFLLITRETVQLNPAADVWLDVVALAQLLAGRPSLDRLEQAVALCRGPFLEGFTLEDSPTFDEWLLLKRGQVDRQVLSALHRLAEAYITRSQYAWAAVYARRQIELDPWDEAAHRQLMVALALDGQRGPALAQYEVCRRRLAEELGVAPARETSDLYDSIRTATLHDVLSRPHNTPCFPAVVTREHELAQLHTHLDLALAGDGRVVFVTGDAGSGKTTLMHEFGQSALAAHGSVVVASGRCSSPMGVGDPYLPFGEIIQMLTGDIEAQRAGGGITSEQTQRLWAVVPTAAQALVETAMDLVDRFVSAEALALRVEAVTPVAGRAPTPSWRARLADHVKRQADSQLLAAVEQTHLFEQVTTFLHTVARSHPLILLLDDLQWADTCTISLLFHLGRHLAASRILVVGAYRPEDVTLGLNGGPHPLATVVHELQSELGEIELDLNQAEGRAFIEALLDSVPNRLDETFRATLYRHTEGHPLFTVELLRDMQERGELTCDEAGRWREGPSLDWERLPRRVEAAIAERVERLPSEYRTLLEVAAVEGEAFTAEVVARVVGCETRQVTQELSGPLSKQHRVVVADSLQRVDHQRLSRYHFRHALFQNYVYRRLDEVERAHLHEAVAVALGSIYGGQAAEVAVELAWHFEQAGVASQAAEYLLRAGQRAARLAAYREAGAYFTRGLELLRTVPDTVERARLERDLQLALGTAVSVMPGWGARERIDAYTRAVELSGQLGEAEESVPARHLLALASTANAQYRQGFVQAEQLFRQAEEEGSPRLRVLAHRTMGAALFHMGEFTAARNQLEQAVSLLEPSERCELVALVGEEIEAAARATLSIVLWLLGFPDGARGQIQEALGLAQAVDHPPTQAFVHTCANTLFRLLRDARAAAEQAQAMMCLAREKGLPGYEPWATIAGGWAQVEAGSAGEGLAQMLQGLDAWRATGVKLALPSHLAQLAEAHGRVGQTQEGLAAVDEALALVEQTGERIVEAEIHRLRGELLAQAADVSAAEGAFRRAIDIAGSQQARSWELRATVSLARLWQRQGRDEEAGQSLAAIYGWFTEGFETPDLVAARTLLDQLLCPVSTTRSAHQQQREPTPV